MKKEEISQESLDKLVDNSSADVFKWNCLSNDDLRTIINLLNIADTAFMEVLVQWKKSFPKAVEQFRICCAIGSFLCDNLLTAYQRIVAITVLYGISAPLYQSIIVDTYESSSDTLEKRWIYMLLREPSFYEQVSKLTLNEAITWFTHSTETRRQVTSAEEKTIRKMKSEQISDSITRYESLAIRATIPVPPSIFSSDNKLALDRIGDRDFVSSPPHAPMWTQEEIDRELHAAGAFSSEVAAFESLSPSFMQWAPPVMEISDQEMMWLEEDESAVCLLWDSNSSKIESSKEQMMELMASALAAPLNPKQQQQLIPQLVENNSSVAVASLVQLLSSSGHGAMDYLSVLAEMGMSFHSIEVVNGLNLFAGDAEIPKDFLHRYISNCIRSCEEMIDKFMQIRFVRLVCVLIQSLIRKRVSDIKDLFAEVQTFCLTFPRVKEAISLFRLIKTLEGTRTPSAPEQIPMRRLEPYTLCPSRVATLCSSSTMGPRCLRPTSPHIRAKQSGGSDTYVRGVHHEPIYRAYRK
eukprot:gene34422-44466_t